MAQLIHHLRGIKFLEENIIFYRYVSIAFDLVGHWFVEGVFARLTKIDCFFISLVCWECIFTNVP
jgi:hypothetical protein